MALPVVPIAIVVVVLILVVYFMMGTSSGSATVYVPAVKPDGTPTAAGVQVATSGTPSQQAAQVADTQAAIEACKLPAGIADGDVIRCSVTGGIAKVVGCKKQWYPNMAVYQKYGSPAFKEVPCADYDAVASGPNFERLTIGNRTISVPILAGATIAPAPVRAPTKISDVSNLSSVFRR